jgi:hypothetical protein
MENTKINGMDYNFSMVKSCSSRRIIDLMSITATLAPQTCPKQDLPNFILNLVGKSTT